MFSSRTNGGVFRRRSGRTASRLSAKFNWMLKPELTALRYSYEEAGPIIEDLGPFGWGGVKRTWPVAGVRFCGRYWE
jgi:hypothetical protein